MEFYVIDSTDKRIRHRVSCEDIIMCYSFKDGCYIVLVNRPDIVLKNSIDSIYDFYFKKLPMFIRSSANHIINTNHIITAEERSYSDEMLITLTNNNKAMLRRGHEYAYFILNGHKKPKAGIKNSEDKDKIIMSDIKDAKQIVQEIYEATGERVNTRWVVKRYKELKINQ